MPLESVYSFVSSNMAPKPIDDPLDQLVDSFLHELKTTKDVNALRLLICMGIDIRRSIKEFGNSNISGNSTIRSLRDCVLLAEQTLPSLRSFPTKAPAQIRFSWAQSQISPSKHVPCGCPSPSIEGYIRVSSFKQYMLYVVKPNMNPKVNPDISDDIDINEIKRYYYDFILNGKFSKLFITRLGRTNSWVFAADKNEIDCLGHSGMIPPDEVIDRLGFYLENIERGSHYLLLAYDPKILENFYQPDSLTGDWGSVASGGQIGRGNEFFLSYPWLDDWGRTQSVSGSRPPLRERVHKSFDHNDSRHYQMTAASLGDLNTPIARSNNFMILKEALIRFQTA